MAQGVRSNRGNGAPGGSVSPTPVAPAADPSAPVPPAAPADPVQGAIGLLRQIVAALVGILLGPLTAAARKRLPKVRQKAWRLVERFLNLAIQKPGYCPAGKDPQELLQEYQTLSGLLLLLSDMASARTSIEDTVRQREAELWKSVLVIYGIAQAQAGTDPAVADLVSQMKQAMSVGPRAQKSVKAAIKPTAVKGKKVKEAVLSAARAEAGIPDPNAPATPAVAEPSGPASHPASPASTPVAPPAPAAPSAPPSGGSNGSAPVPGSAH